MPFDGLAGSFDYLAKFDEVIELVEQPNRWIKHDYGNRDGRYCLVGALNTVGVRRLFEPIILKAINEVADKEFCCIEAFNDHPDTLHRDVVCVLYRARGHIAAGRFRAPAATRLTVFGKTDRRGQATAGGMVGGFWRSLFR